MLENLIQLVKEHAGDAIYNNPLIPADKKDQAVQTAGLSIVSGLKQVAAEGGIKDLMHFFSGREANIMDNPIMKKISSQFSADMSSGMGIGPEQATVMGSALLPPVMTSMISKSNDPADSHFDIQSLFNELSNGKTSAFNISGLFNKVKAGMDRDGDGDVDFDDLKKAFSGLGSSIRNVFK